MPLFDTYVMVDWSAASRRAPAEPKEAAIWWAVHPLSPDASHQFEELGTEKQIDGYTSVFLRDVGVQVYERSRTEAIENIRRFLRHEAGNERRVLVGFDFAFGYPKGFLPALREAGVIEKPTARMFWEWMSGAISDDKDGKLNANNRFEVAGQMNRALRSRVIEHGPFWGHPKGVPDVPPENPYASDRGRIWPFCFPKRRVTERRATGATPSTLWQLHWGPSVVGSQALMGLPRLHRLHCDLNDAKVWPFQTGLQCPVATTSDPCPRIVVVEIYPSLLKKHYQGKSGVTDSAQVRVNARAFAHLDQNHPTLFRSLFRGPSGLTEVERKSVTEEEGWILGVGFEKEINDAVDDVFASEGASK